MQGCSFYLVSTPLHLFLSSSIALQTKEHRNILIFIDQAEVESNFYFRQIRQWDTSPFEKAYIFPGRVDGLLAKRRSRKETFDKLRVLIEEYKPTHIHVGNDRRIEFQYCMHHSQQYGGAQGVYIDEGTYTYLGRPPSLGPSDMVIDNVIKKIVYGHWWKNPPTIGGSVWVSKVYAAFPKLIHPLLRSKEIIGLKPEWLTSESLEDFSRQLLKAKNIQPENVKHIDVLLALPHESIIARNDDYRASMLSLVNKLQHMGKTVGVKYHPRDAHPDALRLQEKGCELIPAKVNFEALLLVLPTNLTIVGDFSSVLLNARWLRPDLKVIAALEDIQSSPKHMVKLYSSLGINMVELSEFDNLSF